MTSSDHSYIYGDFDICPLESDKPGHLRRACVAGMEKLVVQNLRSSRPPFRLLSTWPADDRAAEENAAMKHQRGMISRHWNGIARPGQAQVHIDHLKTDTLPKLAQIRGFVGASILRRELDEGTEFQIVTVWQSLDAIQAFSGSTADRAVVPPVVQRLMTSYDTTVAHYEIADTFDAFPP